MLLKIISLCVRSLIVKTSYEVTRLLDFGYHGEKNKIKSVIV